MKTELMRHRTSGKMTSVQTALAGARLPVRANYDEADKAWVFEGTEGCTPQNYEILMGICRLFIQFFGTD